MNFNQSELMRYSRQMVLPEVGSAGQEKLKKSRVLVVGAGGLGSPVLLYLAAAGVGTLAVTDFDAIDLSNLQRQIMYDSSDVGQSKTAKAARRLRSLNSEIEVIANELPLGPENALALVEGYDVVVDGTDNFATRYLINDACVMAGKKNVYGSIYRFEGQCSVFGAQGGPCYRCMFPEPPEPDAVPNCAEAGVLGAIAGIVGCIQATEVLKLLLEQGDPLVGRLLLVDALAMTFDCVKVARSKACPVCGDTPTIRTLTESSQLCRKGDESMRARQSETVSATQLRDELASGKDIFLLDVRNMDEYLLCRLPNSVLIPLPQLTQRIGELADQLASQQEIVVYCHAGVRSRRALEILSARGFAKVRNLVGGIHAWAIEVDTTMPVY